MVPVCLPIRVWLMQVGGGGGEGWILSESVFVSCRFIRMNEQCAVAPQVKGLSLVIEIEALLRRWASTRSTDDTALCARHPRQSPADEI